MGVAKVANDRVKGSLTRQKLQNSKVYAKSPEFSPALGLIYYIPTRLHYPVRLHARVMTR